MNNYPDSQIQTYKADITNESELNLVKKELLSQYGHIDILINNAANNPKVENQSENLGNIRFDNFGIAEKDQIIKPITYSVIKHGLIGLTKYLATYWADKNIRVNAVCPAGVENGQDKDFVRKLTNLVPMGRMANVDEYQCTVLYMISDASSYMTGSTVIVDGGRTCW